MNAHELMAEYRKQVITARVLRTEISEFRITKAQQEELATLFHNPTDLAVVTGQIREGAPAPGMITLWGRQVVMDEENPTIKEDS